MSTPRETLVFGPAYLDRVILVDRPLIDPTIGGVIDRSASGRWIDRGDGATIRVVGLPEGDLSIDLPPGWPGPSGTVAVDGGSPSGGVRSLRAVDWRETLGGMGAGFAKALGGRLVTALGDDADPVTRRVRELLAAESISRSPVLVPGRLGEWTLLISSGIHGDKLPIGFRDPRPVLWFPQPVGQSDLLVMASMTNAGIASALSSTEAGVRLFAPALRNMADRSPAVSSLAKSIDILCCNRAEWEALADREEVAWRVSILSVTDGPRGAEIRYTMPTGDAGLLEVPAFPRHHHPRDTNRAGEAFASTLVTTLLDAGWGPGVTADALIREAALRASAASALVLDRIDFGFPTPSEIDEAIVAGVIT